MTTVNCGGTQPVDPIDQSLSELRQSMGNTLVMIDICMQLRRNSAHLVQLARSMMVDLCAQIDQALPTLPTGEGEDNA